jgi:hypothetical protein
MKSGIYKIGKGCDIYKVWKMERRKLLIIYGSNPVTISLAYSVDRTGIFHLYLLMDIC